MAYQNPIVSLPKKEQKKTKRTQQHIGKEYMEMSQAYFVFIDVLGFKETFNKGNHFKSVFEYFNLLIDSMSCIANDSTNCYAGQTSDSLYFYTSKIEYLVEFIKVFLHFNVYAMSKNVYFRGGIAKGTLYYNKPYQFYGDCVINAYLLEESISKYPRITIDDKTMKDLEKYDLEWSFDPDKHRHFLNPFSKQIFDDICTYLCVPSPTLQVIDIKLIKKVQSEIKKNIEKYEMNSPTFEKYWYLLDRCNEILK